MKRFYLPFFLVICFLISGCTEYSTKKAWKVKAEALSVWADTHDKQVEIWETIVEYWEDIAMEWEKNPEEWEKTTNSLLEADSLLEEGARAFSAWKNARNNNALYIIMGDSSSFAGYTVLREGVQGQITELQGKIEVQKESIKDLKDVISVEEQDIRLSIVAKNESLLEILQERVIELEKAEEETRQLAIDTRQKSRDYERQENAADQNYWQARAGSSSESYWDDQRVQLQHQASESVKQAEKYDKQLRSNFNAGDNTVGVYARRRAKEIEESDRQEALDIAEEIREEEIPYVLIAVEENLSANIEEEIMAARLTANLARTSRDRWGKAGWSDLKLMYEESAKAWDMTARKWQELSLCQCE